MHSERPWNQVEGRGRKWPSQVGDWQLAALRWFVPLAGGGWLLRCGVSTSRIKSICDLLLDCYYLVLLDYHNSH